jgi:hypothetical protein
MDSVRTIVESALRFEEEAQSLLAVHEAAESRVVLLEDSYSKLAALSLQQDDLLKQALRCLENKLFRAAHVMSWAAFIDFLEQKLASDGFKKLRGARPNWRVTTVDDLRESYGDHAIILGACDAGLCSKSQMKALLGLLNKRNECAHPSNYFPGLNETLGYLSELFQRIETLRAKPY